MNFCKYIPEFEKEYGKKLDAVVISFIEQLSAISDKFESKGKEDGTQGKPAPSLEAFTTWSSKVFDHPEMRDCIAAIMQKAYMDGYKAGSKEGGAAL